MENTVKLKIFVLLAGCVFFVFGFSFFGAKAYGAFFTKDTVPEGVTVSGVELSGLSEKEATDKLDAAIKSWYENSFYFLQADKELSLDLTVVKFDVDKTVDLALENKTANISAKIDGAGLNQLLQNEISSETLKALDRNALSKELAAAASELVEGIYSISLDKFYIKEKLPKTILLSTSLPNETFTLENSLTVTIDSKQTFSLHSYIEENKLKTLDEHTLKWLATAIYQTILPTNFVILERHISHVLPSYSELGKEASYIAGKQDFIFFNPNETAYELKLTQDENFLNITLEGINLQKAYSLTMENDKKYKPKKIVQYDPKLPENTTRIEQEGIDGQSITVYRNELDKNGNIANTVLIADDYYAPVHQIEKTALQSIEEVPDLQDPLLPNDSENPDFDQSEDDFNNGMSEYPEQNTNLNQNPNLNQKQVPNQQTPAEKNTVEENELWEEPAFEKGEG
ncbi:G5 domain-containing protein [Metabacillus idriensis]|uniref:G5 domain-containing protein n=1 Tax=Metabacillus idriensis TaxID=324768 RepID=UPI00174C46CF|nr:G5 domain-containing protein [Metabacillus idriensis]